MVVGVVVGLGRDGRRVEAVQNKYPLDVVGPNHGCPKWKVFKWTYIELYININCMVTVMNPV